MSKIARAELVQPFVCALSQGQPTFTHVKTAFKAFLDERPPITPSDKSLSAVAHLHMTYLLAHSGFEEAARRCHTGDGSLEGLALVRDEAVKAELINALACRLVTAAMPSKLGGCVPDMSNAMEKAASLFGNFQRANMPQMLVADLRVIDTLLGDLEPATPSVGEACSAVVDVVQAPGGASKLKATRALAAFLQSRVGKHVGKLVSAAVAKQEAAVAKEQEIDASIAQLRDRAVDPVNVSEKALMELRKGIVTAVGLVKAAGVSSRSQDLRDLVESLLHKYQVAVVVCLKPESPPGKEHVKFMGYLVSLVREWRSTMLPVLPGAQNWHGVAEPTAPEVEAIARLCAAFREAEDHDAAKGGFGTLSLRAAIDVGLLFHHAVCEASVNTVSEEAAWCKAKAEEEGDFEEAIETMCSTLKGHLCSVGKALKSICGEAGTDNLAITYEQAASECWDDENHIKKDWAAKLAKLDQCAEIGKIEEVLGINKILAAAGGDSDCEEVAKKLNTLMGSMAALVAAARLQQHSGFAAGETVDLEAEERFWKAFQVLAKELPATAQEEEDELMAKLRSLKAAMSEMLKDSVQHCKTFLEGCKSAMEPKVMDIKAMFKDPAGFDDAVSNLIAYEGRNEFVSTLKNLQGKRGLQRLDMLAACVSSSHVHLEEDLAKFKADAHDFRQKCRLQISCRSAALILQKGRREDLASFFADCKALKVLAKLPATLKQRLDDLGKSA